MDLYIAQLLDCHWLSLSLHVQVISAVLIYSVASVLHWDVRFVDRHAVQSFLTLLSRLHLLVMSEMLNVLLQVSVLTLSTSSFVTTHLRMNQILLGSILVMIQLPMMNLILILVVPVMSWPVPKIR